MKFPDLFTEEKTFVKIGMDQVRRLPNSHHLQQAIHMKMIIIRNNTTNREESAMIRENTQVYILTEEGRAYTDEGIKYVLSQIRNTFNDTSEVVINQGALYNQPDVLSEFLRKDPEHSYVFISHEKGLEIMYDINDINRFIRLLDSVSDDHTTAWEMIMKELNLL